MLSEDWVREQREKLLIELYDGAFVSRTGFTLRYIVERYFGDEAIKNAKL